MPENILQKIEKTKKVILPKSGFKPVAAVIAGSGLGGLKLGFTVHKSIPYSKISYFPKTTVSGHAGELNLCSFKGTDFFIMNGRFHYYEGYSAQEVAYPVRVMNASGVKTLIITAACGAINEKYAPGDVVLLKDQINFTGNSPLIGKHFKEFGERFPDMSAVYDETLRKKALSAAKKFKIKAREGVYFGISGPSYETPAEVKAYRILGGDLTGMSVVYEAAAAAQMKMKVSGIAYVSNMATGVTEKAFSHDEVLSAGKKAGDNIVKIIKNILEDCN